MLPLMIYENMFKILNDYDKKNINIVKKIYKNLYYGDLIGCNMYIEQNWFVQTIHGFFTCYWTNFYLNKYNLFKDIQIIFWTELNKSSLRNINKKKNIIKNFCNDFLTLNDVN